jgi:shikimate kinase
MVDDAVASLVPEYLITDEWTNQWLVDRIPNPDVVIYKNGAWDSANPDYSREMARQTRKPHEYGIFWF